MRFWQISKEHLYEVVWVGTQEYWGVVDVQVLLALIREIEHWSLVVEVSELWKHLLCLLLRLIYDRHHLELICSIVNIFFVVFWSLLFYLSLKYPGSSDDDFWWPFCTLFASLKMEMCHLVKTELDDNEDFLGFWYNERLLVNQVFGNRWRSELMFQDRAQFYLVVGFVHFFEKWR